MSLPPFTLNKIIFHFENPEEENVNKRRSEGKIGRGIKTERANYCDRHNPTYPKFDFHTTQLYPTHKGPNPA